MTSTLVRLTCDHPGCPARTDVWARVGVGGWHWPGGRGGAAPGWQAPVDGDPVEAPAFCPEHRPRR